MNAYYHHNEDFVSNKGIINAYFGASATRVSVGEKLLSMLLALVRFLTCATVRRITKATAVAVTLVAFIGVIGAMESGALGLGAGLFIGAILLGIEYLCLRPHRA